MKKILYTLCLFLFFLSSCSVDKDGRDGDYSLSNDSDRFFDGPASDPGTPGNGQGSNAGLITAGEWNDLVNWSFWNDLLEKEDYKDHPDYWSFHPLNRVAVSLKNNSGQPLNDVKIDLKKADETIWSTRTDNQGQAELWIDLYQKNDQVNISQYHIVLAGGQTFSELKLYQEGINEIVTNNTAMSFNDVEIAFVVDATGSMGDELEFLKKDLEDVIKRVEADNGNINIRTSAVFYRDQEDDYLTRKSDFSGNISTTLDFITQQSAGGGGDFPEAVHTGLSQAIDELQWSEQARTRITFLLLDAPPHHNPQVIDDLQGSVQKAAAQGIKIIPITASGIDKQTEFLMRFFSIATNGTYVFITNDSGIGNDHIEASVGEHEIEFLNNLMVRLLNQYIE